MMDGERKGFPDSEELVSELFRNSCVAGDTLRARHFEDCGFTGCNFSDATLTDCKFVDCTFNQCNWSNVRIDTTRFSNVEFVECKMLGVDWTRATWPRVAVGAPLQFRKSILDDCSFFGLKLEEIVVEDCLARRCDFREADLARSVFRRTDLADARFGKTRLTEADFSAATNYSIDVLDNDVERARFSRAEALSLLDSLGIELVD